MNDAGTVYDDVIKHHNVRRRKQSMPARIQFLSHNLMQRGESMRTRKAEHPKHTRDLTNVFDFGTGRKQRSDTKGRVDGSVLAPGPPPKRISLLRQKQKKSLWLNGNGGISFLAGKKSKPRPASTSSYVRDTTIDEVHNTQRIVVHRVRSKIVFVLFDF